MIRIHLLLFCLLFTSRFAGAQVLIPFDYVSEEENHLIRETDSFKYYVSSGDSSNIVCLSDEGDYYKLISKSQKVLAEGNYIIDGEKYLQTGKWIARFDNGKVKVAGVYLRNRPIGTWQEYYSTGKIKTLYNFAIITNEKGGVNYCMSGSWQEYYPNGKLSVNGYYAASETKVNDTVVVDDPITDQKVTKLITHVRYTPVKTGTWEYYSETGELDKKEEF